MENIIRSGRWVFILSFLTYVALHVLKPDTGADFVPDFLPFPLIWNYVTGLCVLAFIVSCLLRRYDKLATLLMALYVTLVTLLVHVPLAATSENDALNIFRNIMVIGALLMYAGAYAQDKRIIG
ncbi:MAG: hypothetical protein SF053_05825 [Bacteroidia bacterium]|nr:hypothetical protein [Bacteroidia bacterium]